jgi:glutaredoxin
MYKMYYQIFGKKRCKFCTKATKLLDAKKIQYVMTYLDNAPDVLAELKNNLEWKTVPIVLEVAGNQSTFLGGYTELEEYLNGTKKGKKAGRGENTDQSDSLQAEGIN